MSVGDAAQAVRRLTPLAAEDVRELGRGADSVAFLVDGEWVFRFPAAAEAQATLRLEIALLPALAPTLPLPVPAFEHVGVHDGELAFVGYRVVAGVPLTAERFDALDHDEQERLLASLASFLEALHAFPLRAATDAGAGEELVKGGYHPGQRALVAEAGALLRASERARLHAVFDDFERDHGPGARRPVLLHADLKPDHVLYDPRERRVAGVIDWGDACLGDGDFDLAVTAMFFGAGFLARLLGHLPGRDRALVLEKTRFFTMVRRLQDLVYDARRQDRGGVAGSLRTLREHLRSR